MYFSFIPLRQKKSVRNTVNIPVHKYGLAAASRPVRCEIIIFFSSGSTTLPLHADEMWIERSLSPRLFPLLLFLRMLVVCRWDSGRAHLDVAPPFPPVPALKHKDLWCTIRKTLKKNTYWKKKRGLQWSRAAECGGTLQISC